MLEYMGLWGRVLVIVEIMAGVGFFWSRPLSASNKCTALFSLKKKRTKVQGMIHQCIASYAIWYHAASCTGQRFVAESPEVETLRNLYYLIIVVVLEEA